MTGAITEIDQPKWPDLDQAFHREVMALGDSQAGRALRKRAEARFMYAEGKPFLLGPPQLVRAELADTLREVASAYYRAIQGIVDASLEDDAVRSALSTPPALASDLAADRDPENSRVHIMRLDVMPGPEGGFKILETNANCPGGFVFSGICNRAWREFLEDHGYRMPPPLPHEEKGYMAKWFLDVVEGDAGRRPEFLGLIREEGGNRLELEDFAKHLRWQGIECEEVDPREIRYDGAGPARAGNRDLTHAYQKLGMQNFQRLRAGLDAFVAAVRERALFVQNGQRGRWVGDDKLCLAVISDPKFAYLFDPDDLRLLSEFVPWSRNASRLRSDRLEEVRRNQDRFVLKRGLDTRGRGVVVGAGVDVERWLTAVDVAVRESWLVQEFHPTTYVERDFDSPAKQRHDLALGAINGELTTLFMRSSGELRVNMARSGRMHPVFLEA